VSYAQEAVTNSFPRVEPVPSNPSQPYRGEGESGIATENPKYLVSLPTMETEVKLKTWDASTVAPRVKEPVKYWIVVDGRPPSSAALIVTVAKVGVGPSKDAPPPNKIESPSISPDVLYELEKYPPREMGTNP
jgi:hypothetical protein